jgi:hypothetical protein
MYAIYRKYFDSQHHQYLIPARFYSLVKKLKIQVAPTRRSIMKSFPRNIIVRNWNYLDFKLSAVCFSPKASYCIMLAAYWDSFFQRG